jgi:hypothetical protein
MSGIAQKIIAKIKINRSHIMQIIYISMAFVQILYVSPSSVLRIGKPYRRQCVDRGVAFSSPSDIHFNLFLLLLPEKYFIYEVILFPQKELKKLPFSAPVYFH